MTKQRWVKGITGGLVCGVLLLLVALPAQADIPEDITVDTNITASETLDHNIIVHTGATLNVAAGVTLTFLENAPAKPLKIVVESGGRLNLNGLAASPVRLVTDSLTTKFDGWQGIENNGTVVMSYTEIQAASYAIYNCSNSRSEVDNSTFLECSVAIRAENSSFKVFNSVFNSNGDAFMLKNVFSIGSINTSQVCGNTFDSNHRAFYFGGTNQVNIHGNSFLAANGNDIFVFGQTGNVSENSSNEKVVIAYNNFEFNRTLEGYFIVKLNLGTPVGMYNCYWNYNGQVCDTVAEIRTAQIVTPESSVAIYTPLLAPVTEGSDSTAPELLELNPLQAPIGEITLNVVIQDDGWGVDPSTVQILVGGNPATIQTYTYNARQYIFTATINIASIGEYTWSVSASDLAGNAMTAQNLNGQKLIVNIDGTTTGSIIPPTAWESFSVGDYRLITIPIAPYEQDHKIALGLTAPGSTLARWQGGEYVYYGETNLEAFAPGKGYWLRFGQGEAFKVQSISGEKISPKFKVALTSGWHLIGNPFEATLPFACLTFNYGSGVYGHTFVEAVNDEMVGFGLWGYSEGNYQLERENMEAWKGYWIYVKKACEIVFWKDPPRYPLPNYSIAGSKSSFSQVASLTWEARLTVSQSGISDSGNYFGVARSAAVGMDRLDLLKPPALRNSLQSGFQPQGVSQVYGADYRPDAAVQTWRYGVKGLTAGTARLSWSNLEFAPSNVQLILKDLKTGQVVDLRRSNGYEFQTLGESERQFDIQMYNQSIQTLEISNLRLSCNPFAPLRETEVLTYDLSASATMEIKIYDWVGDLVYVHPAYIEVAGTGRQFSWNGRNNRGRLAANGVYFCKVKARNGNAQTEQILKLAVVN